MLWVIGDSWSDPGMDGHTLDGWPWLTAARLGLGLSNSAQGGSGYISVNNSGWTFARQVVRFPCPQASAIAVFGSVNDQPYDPAAVHDAAVETLAAARRIAPTAPLLVIGPQFWNDTIPPAVLAVRAAVQAAAGAADGFLDAVGWMQGRPELVGTDLHPTSAGHAWMTDRIEAALAPLLRQPPTPDLSPAPGGLTYPLVFPRTYAATGDPAPLP